MCKFRLGIYGSSIFGSLEKKIYISKGSAAGQGNFGRKNRPRTEEGGTVFGSLAKPIEPSVYAIPV